MVGGLTRPRLWKTLKVNLFTVEWNYCDVVVTLCVFVLRVWLALAPACYSVCVLFMGVTVKHDEKTLSKIQRRISER